MAWLRHKQRTRPTDRGNNPEWGCGRDARRDGADLASCTSFLKALIKLTGPRIQVLHKTREQLSVVRDALGLRSQLIWPQQCMSGSCTPSDASTSSLWFAFSSPYPDRFRKSLTISQLSNLNIRTSGRSSSTTIMSPGCVTIGERRRPPASTRWVTDDDDSCGIRTLFRITSFHLTV